jgi:hypothetical protein
MGWALYEPRRPASGTGRSGGAGHETKSGSFRMYGGSLLAALIFMETLSSCG